jgi:hypothetical protein
MSGACVKYDLGSLDGGELITVELRERANVLLIDTSNLRSYESGQRDRFIGRQALRASAGASPSPGIGSSSSAWAGQVARSTQACPFRGSDRGCRDRPARLRRVRTRAYPASSRAEITSLPVMAGGLAESTPQHPVQAQAPRSRSPAKRIGFLWPRRAQTGRSTAFCACLELPRRIPRSGPHGDG